MRHRGPSSPLVVSVSSIPHLACLVREVRVGIASWDLPLTDDHIKSFDVFGLLTGLEHLVIQGIMSQMPHETVYSIFHHIVSIVDSSSLRQIQFDFCDVALSLLQELLALPVEVKLSNLSLGRNNDGVELNALYPDTVISPPHSPPSATGLHVTAEAAFGLTWLYKHVFEGYIDLSSISTLHCDPLNSLQQGSTFLQWMGKHSPLVENLSIRMSFEGISRLFFFSPRDLHQALGSSPNLSLRESDEIIFEIPKWPNLRRLSLGTFDVSDSKYLVRKNVIRMLTYIFTLFSSMSLPNFQILELDILASGVLPIPISWDDPSPWTKLDAVLSRTNASFHVNFWGTYAEARISVNNLKRCVQEGMPLLIEGNGFSLEDNIERRSYYDAIVDSDEEGAGASGIGGSFIAGEQNVVVDFGIFD
ncbi:hypothetical protein DL96DRAFT_1604654 [Flagelloscypha sp. PMI_526]|nr:hypothetical protein DL96DRAFT_1604654 [Flagelloscypha sp. PMI_526]